MSDARESDNVVPLCPRVVGAGVFAYMFFQRAAGEPVPNPDNPAEVDVVIDSVANYTTWKREELELIRPAIEACMRTLIIPPEDLQ